MVLHTARRRGIGLRLVLLCWVSLWLARVVLIHLRLLHALLLVRVPVACVGASRATRSLSQSAARGLLYLASRHSYLPPAVRSSVAGPTSIALRFVPLPVFRSMYVIVRVGFLARRCTSSYVAGVHLRRRAGRPPGPASAGSAVPSVSCA